PTLLGIMILNFVIIQAAPGGPVEQMIARLQGTAVSATARLEGDRGDMGSQGQGSQASTSSAQPRGDYRGARGLPPEFIADLERMYGFDKPLWQQFTEMMGRYLRFDFGKSFFRDTSVIDLILEKMPVSISLGVWTTLLTYLISIPLGIRKAVRDGSNFDVWTSGIIIIGNAIPGFLFAILLIVLFAGGSYLDWFPLRGLTSENWNQLSWGGKIVDYIWHMVLPIVSLMIGA
ncbi:MAG: microcin ABC transporter permease, partial [Geminicoccaceae bacterium]|nr:microcin ABC transporter permease [Geminicoccaceae bacterium]